MDQHNDPLGRVWFSSRDAAAYLGYRSAETVMRAFRDGRLPGSRTSSASGRGGNVRFHRAHLDRFASGDQPAQLSAAS